MKEKKIAAYFDFDGTIYNGIVAYDVLKFAFFNRMMKISEAVSLSKLIYYYALDKFNLADRHWINDKMYQKVRGWNSAKLEKASEEFFRLNIKNKLFKDVAEIIKWHVKNKHKIIVITSALREMVNPARKFIKIDEIISTEVETKNDVYTGKIKSLPIGETRINIIKKHSIKNGIELGKSYAYSDHYSDIPMLENLGNAIAVHPDRRLKKHALLMGWKIIDH